MKKHIIITALLIACFKVNAQIPDTDMITVAGGSFTMGNSVYTRESPTRNITVSTFYMSKNVVTNAQFAEFLNAYGSSVMLAGDNAGKPLFVQDSWGIIDNNGLFQPATGYENFPAIKVTWYGATTYCEWAGGRLPTETEWEYAAKGGVNKETFTYSGSNDPAAVSWYYYNSGLVNKQAGTKTANSLGLYDMSGNVYQWCSDWYGRYTDILSLTTDPKGAEKGVSKVIRGGYRASGPTDLHLTHRESISPDESYNFVGFRLVKTSLTSIDKVNDNSIKIFPNPAKDFINIQTKKNIETIEIINSSGSTVLVTDGNNKTLSVNNLSNGLYIIRIKDNSHEKFIQKLLIER